MSNYGNVTPIGQSGNWSAYTTPIPGAASYLMTQNIAKKAYENALARINASRTNRLTAAGYLQGANGQLTVNPNDPYGGLQMMLRNQAIDNQQVDNQNLQRGLRGGLANQNISQARYQHGAESAQFGRSLQNDLGDLALNKSDAQTTYNSALWQAQLDAVRQAIAEQQFNAVKGVPTSGDSTIGGGTTTTATTPNQQNLVQQLMQWFQQQGIRPPVG